jgi:SAM-dependent methyltransferase
MDRIQWKEWWRQRALAYFTDKVWTFSNPRLIERLGIEKYHYVLELGFGYGRELSNFCKISDHVHGLELEQYTCDLALKGLTEEGIYPLPTVMPYDGVNIPFPDSNFFDVIYSCFVVQHMSKEHVKELIHNCLVALLPTGKILFEFFGDPDYHDPEKDVFSGIDGEGGMFNSAYTLPEIEKLVKECGARVLWAEPWKITSQWGNYWVCFTK